MGCVLVFLKARSWVNKGSLYYLIFFCLRLKLSIIKKLKKNRSPSVEQNGARNPQACSGALALEQF